MVPPAPRLRILISKLDRLFLYADKFFTAG
jgi:hypothetical protein